MDRGIEKLMVIFEIEGVTNYVMERRVMLMAENRNIDYFKLVFS